MVTPDDARAALRALFQEFGVPQHVMFINLWQRATDSLVAAIKAQGLEAIQEKFLAASQAGAVLAGVQVSSASQPTPPTEGG